MATIDVRNLSKDFGDFAAVRAASFTVEDGQFVCLLGPSGCGKTTTLRMIAGLELPTSGSISLAGKDVTHKRASERDIAFVFQLFALYPHMNVRRNIEYPLRNIGMPKAERTRRVAEAARILRIGHLLDRSVSGLSSGDRQRVALGRAIVREPAAFMMDEPLGALDAEFRHLMCGELRALHDRLRATTVYVTHDQLEAMAMADRIAVMNAGVIEQFGPPQDIYDRPATLFVADFIGSPPMNFVGFAGSFARGDRAIRIGDASQPVPELREDRAEAEHILGVRPEHVRLSDEGWLRGEVYGSEYLGTTQVVTVRTPRGPVRARLPASASVQRGETVGLAFKPDKLTIFDRATGRAVRTALTEGGLAHG
jgi:multiple sugar transport system ATP-binding protein